MMIIMMMRMMMMRMRMYDDDYYTYFSVLLYVGSPTIIHPDNLSVYFVVVDMDELLSIMTLLDSSEVAVLYDCML